MPRFRTGGRRSKRTKSVVPVRLWIAGSEDSHLAHTLDVSNRGVKFGGCRGEIKIGDKIEVLYRHKHAQARVAWITAPEAPRRSKLGLSFWSWKSGCGVWSSPSKRMSMKKKISRHKTWIAEPSNWG